MSFFLQKNIWSYTCLWGSRNDRKKKAGIIYMQRFVSIKWNTDLKKLFVLQCLNQNSIYRNMGKRYMFDLVQFESVTENVFQG